MVEFRSIFVIASCAPEALGYAGLLRVCSAKHKLQ